MTNSQSCLKYSHNDDGPWSSRKVSQAAKKREERRRLQKSVGRSSLTTRPERIRGGYLFPDLP